MKLYENDLKELVLRTLMEVAGESEKQDAIDWLSWAFKGLTKYYKMPDKEARELLAGYRRMIEKYDLETVRGLYRDKYGNSKTDFTSDDVQKLVGKNKLNLNPEFFKGRDAGWLKRTQDGFDAEMERRRLQSKKLNDPIMREGVTNENKMFILNADYLLSEYFKNKKSLI
jgi:hypothetical protein